MVEFTPETIQVLVEENEPDFQEQLIKPLIINFSLFIISQYNPIFRD